MPHLENNICAFRILPVFWKKYLLICCFLLTAIFSAAAAPFSDSSADELAERGYANIPAEARVVLTGADILGGHGVSVVYPTQAPRDYSGYLPFEYQCTAGGCFQCIEFVLWLYDRQLGYPYQWPGAIWNPYQLIGVAQVANQLTYQLDTGLITTQDARYRLYEAYIDLRYYPNGSSAAPQPGDILISADGGHSMVVNRSGGDQLEIVQQNAWEIVAEPQPSALEMRQVYNTSGSFSVQGSLGWIHSPRWAQVLTLSGSQQTVGTGFRWTRAPSSLTLYLPGALELTEESLNAILRELSAGGALRLTSPAYVACALGTLQNNPALAGGGGSEVNIPYLGSMLTVLMRNAQPSASSLEIPLDNCKWNG
jgi:hypothetical protein